MGDQLTGFSGSISIGGIAQPNGWSWTMETTKVDPAQAIDQMSRQLGIDLRQWLSPCADHLEEQGKEVPWGPERSMEERDAAKS